MYFFADKKFNVTNVILVSYLNKNMNTLKYIVIIFEFCFNNYDLSWRKKRRIINGIDPKLTAHEYDNVPKIKETFL